MTVQSHSYFREQADRCRRLMRAVGDPLTESRLNVLATEYERRADMDERKNVPDQPEPAAPDPRNR